RDERQDGGGDHRELPPALVNERRAGRVNPQPPHAEGEEGRCEPDRQQEDEAVSRLVVLVAHDLIPQGAEGGEEEESGEGQPHTGPCRGNRPLRGVSAREWGRSRRGADQLRLIRGNELRPVDVPT